MPEAAKNASLPSENPGGAGFFMYEDPPTCKVTLPTNSFVHSTPFGGGDAFSQPESKPLATPIAQSTAVLDENEEQSNIVHDDNAENGLSPILEASNEVSVLSSSGENAHVIGNQAKVSWPLSMTAKNQILSTINLESVINMRVAHGQKCPSLSVGDKLVSPIFAGPLIIEGQSSDENSNGQKFIATTPPDPASINAVSEGYDEDDDEEAEPPRVKVTLLSAGVHPWEYIVLAKTHTNLARQADGKTVSRSIPACKALDVYEDKSVSVIGHNEGSTLYDVIAMACKTGKDVEEPLIMFYTIEILRILNGIHEAGIIHCNIVTENLLLRDEPIDDADWEIMYSPSGQGGWNAKGLWLQGFEDAVDLSCMGSSFRLSYRGDSWQQKVSEQHPNGWTHEVDYHGVCDVLHQLLHGEPLKIVQDATTGRWTPARPFRRFWQVHFFVPLICSVLSRMKFATRISDRQLLKYDGM